MTDHEDEPGARSCSVAAGATIGGLSPAGPWQAVFWATFTILAICKIWLAVTLSPFVDEAFYWQESRHLAWSYSDVPGLTAWLIRCGETVFGHSTFGMRAPFLLLGLLMPVLMLRMVTRIADFRAGCQAGLWLMVLPLAGTLGVLALPDVPLTFASLLALDAFERASRDGRLRDWALLGAALALAWLSHYRAGLLLLAGLAFLMLTPRGRGLWRIRGLWISLAIALIGLLPLLLFNMQHDWAGVGFQLVDRHPWSFHADALIQPVEQALVVTPVLYAMLLMVLWLTWRRRAFGAPWDLFLYSALVPLLVYFVFGLFADDERFRVHWPLPGYVPLLALLPIVAREWSRRWRLPAMFVGATCAALGTLAVFAYLLAASVPALTRYLVEYKAFPAHFSGWRESAAMVENLLGGSDPDQIILVADNFMLAAQFDFAFDGRRKVYTLDNPLNAKHGRSPQLHLWSLDEAGLHQHAGKRVLLAVAETALRERDRANWSDGLCQRIAQLQPIEQLSLFSGRKRFAFYSGSVPIGKIDAGCTLPAFVPLTESARPLGVARHIG